MNSEKKSTMDNNSPICAYLKSLRKQYKHTQSATAELLNISKSTYSHYEEGRCCLPIDIALSLSDLYGVDINEFIIRMDERQFKKSIEENESTKLLVEMMDSGYVGKKSATKDCLRWMSKDESYWLDYIRKLPITHYKQIMVFARFINVTSPMNSLDYIADLPLTNKTNNKTNNENK